METRDVWDIESAAQFRTPEFSAVCRGMKKLDWRYIQQLYDSGYTYRRLTDEGHASNTAIAKAVKRGDLKTRDVSNATTRFYQNGGKQDWTPERRAKLSERMKELFKVRPELHPNRKVANNKSKMSYPERLAYCFFEDNGFDFVHQKQIGPYWADFMLQDSLIVEVDGQYWHNDDSVRDGFIISKGYRIERFAAKNIIAQLNARFGKNYLISRKDVLDKIFGDKHEPEKPDAKTLCRCGVEIYADSKSCRACEAKKRLDRNDSRISLNELRREAAAGGNLSSYGKRIGVSANAVKNWCLRRGLIPKYCFASGRLELSECRP